jgi:competence protein ComEA
MPGTLAPPGLPGPGPEQPDADFWATPQRQIPRGLRRPPGAGGALDRVLDRLHAWRGDTRLGVALLVLLAVAAALVWFRVGLGGDPPEPEPAPAAGVETPPSSGPAGDTGGPVVVHVAGAVAQPGVVELPEDSRVIDAVEAAGGGLPEADLDRLNLAARLIDGQRVLVQKVGDPTPPAEPGAAPPGGTEAGTDAAAPGLINVNTATQAELETLPGIGPVLAEAIITERERRGGFRSVNELREVRGIGDARFADIETLVTV